MVPADNEDSADVACPFWGNSTVIVTGGENESEKESLDLDDNG